MTIVYDTKEVSITTKGKKKTLDFSKKDSAAVDSVFEAVNFETEIKTALAFEVYEKIKAETETNNALDLLGAEKQPIGLMRLLTCRVKALVREEKPDSGCWHWLWTHGAPVIEFTGVGQPKWIEPPEKRLVNVDSVQITFSDGTVKDILLLGTMDDKTGKGCKPVSFMNRFPIALTTRKDVQKFNTHSDTEIKLYSSFAKSDTDETALPYEIDIHDLLFYAPKLASSGNYIPENRAVTLKNGAQDTEILLFKKGFADDFDIRLYTDVTGLQKESTNGLVQIDGRYNIILNAHRSENWFVRLLSGFIQPTYIFFPSSDITLFHKISPYLTFSKIEDKGSLALETHRFSTVDSAFNSANSFDLFKYSNLNLGVDLNISRLQMIAYNLNVNVDVVAGVFRTPVDSAFVSSRQIGNLTEQNLFSWFYMPELVLQAVYSDKIDFDLRLGFMHSKLFNSKLSSSANEVVVEGTAEARYFTFYQINFNIFADEKDRDSWVFLRASLMAAGSQSNLSLQLGYATSIGKLIPSSKPNQ
jgi:hypothetical protein